MLTVIGYGVVSQLVTVAETEEDNTPSFDQTYPASAEYFRNEREAGALDGPGTYRIVMTIDGTPLRMWKIDDLTHEE